MKTFRHLLIILTFWPAFVLGQVGIGTTAPTQQLELTQSLKLPSTTSNITGILFKDSYPFLHDFRGPIALGYNTFLGVNAGNFTSGGGGDYNGCNNTGIGYWALNAISTGYANTAVGAFALPAVSTGYENTAIGLQAMNATTSGIKNTAIGYMAAHENSTGGYNTVVGFGANYNNQAGSSNTIIGYEAGRGSALHSKSGNVFIGYQAGFNETGNSKLYIDNSGTTTPLLGGDFNLNELYVNGKLRIADGTQSAGRIFKTDANGNGAWVDPSSIMDGDWLLSGTSLYTSNAGWNVGIGTSAPAQQLEITRSIRMPATTSSSTGVIYKGTAPFIHNFHATSQFDLNTFIGLEAGNFTMSSGTDYQATNNTGTGAYALHAVTNGYENTATGTYALQATTTGFQNSGLGLQCLFSNTSGNRNSTVGAFSLYGNTTGTQNSALGYEANYYNQTGSNNTILGYQAGKGSSLHSKSGNVFLGFQAGFNETGSNKLYIENSNSSTPLIGGDFSLDYAYVNGRLGLGTTAPAQQLDLTLSMRLPNTTSSTTGVVYKGGEAFIHDYNGPSATGGRNLFIGPLAGNFTSGGSSSWQGTSNIGIGNYALHYLTTAEQNVALGYNALSDLTSGSYNTSVGFSSLNSVSTGEFNTAVGGYALNQNITGSYNTGVGYLAGPLNNAFSNCAAFGYQAQPDAGNHIYIGNTAITWIGGKVNWAIYSDERIKKEIRDDVPGLEFILALRPVNYRLDIHRLNELKGTDPKSFDSDFFRQSIAEQEAEWHTGFVAQEVEQAARKCSYEFSGVQAPENEHAPYSLRYAEFVVPLVKAVQELKAENDELRKRLEELEKRIEN